MEEKKNIIIDLRHGKVDFSEKINQINENPENYICTIISNRHHDIEEVLSRLNYETHIVLDGVSEKNYNKLQSFALAKINDVNFDNKATERYQISVNDFTSRLNSSISIDEINKNPNDYEIYINETRSIDAKDALERCMELNINIPIILNRLNKSEYDKISPIYLSGKNYKVNLNENNNIVELYTANIDFTKSDNINLEEIISKLNSQPKMSECRIKANNALDIEKIVQQVDDNVSIILEDVTKNVFDELSPNTLKAKKYYINFSPNDKYIGNINIGDIEKNFSEVQKLYYPVKVLSKNNITDFSQILYILKKSENYTLGLDSELLNQYNQEFKELQAQMKDYREKWYQSQEGNDEAKKYINEFEPKFRELYGSCNIKVSSRGIYNQEEVESYEYYTVEELKEARNYSEVCKGKNIKILVNNMSEISLEMAEKLKSEGFRAKILMNCYDNDKYQNEIYNLDEYIEMSKTMRELIGDIDINLPEDKKFAKIYERVTKYLEYDVPAAYPKNKDEEEYEEKNVRNCRNLRNALLQGKCVCDGFADVLKNACLIKGIECESVGGPIDKVKSKETSIDKFQEVFFEGKKNNIIRDYHAWNKVKINDVWYNCDPTWDSNNIKKGKSPKYALLSDKTYKQIGRATVEDLRHPCKKDMSLKEKSKIFEGLEPSKKIKKDKKLIKFEKNLDEYGNLLPVEQKVFSFNKIFDNLKKIAKNSQEKIKGLFNKTKKEELEINTSSKSKSTIISDKKPSWELTQEQKDEVSAKMIDIKNKENEITFTKEDKQHDENELR